MYCCCCTRLRGNYVYNRQKNKIYLTAGDNAELEICVFDITGAEIKVTSDDKIVLTVRQTPNEPAIFSKEADGRTIYFMPSDTKDMIPGLYVYDVQFTNSDHEINTIITSFFEIGAEITK